MWIDTFGMILSLAVILLSCELFTNGIEWLGRKLNLGDGVVGSIFSAVGTCLPETMIPVIAILFSGSGKSEDIGIGAIMGAPFMLSTLAFFLTGISVLIFRKRRRTGMEMLVNNKILGRDIGFFIIVYSLGLAASFINILQVKYIIAVFLAGCYIYYVMLTVKNDQANHHSELDDLHLIKFLNMKPNLGAILFQIAIALTGIVVGAHLFVSIIENVSETLGLPALVLSLIIAPIATELPEKFNSIIWISKKKDTLALGNISGAMVFQSCIPVSIGILTTGWTLDAAAIVSAVLAISSAFVTFLWIKVKGRLNPIPLMMGGVFYILFILFLVLRGL